VNRFVPSLYFFPAAMLLRTGAKLNEPFDQATRPASSRRFPPQLARRGGATRAINLTLIVK
jgi:hypothetical protein